MRIRPLYLGKPSVLYRVQPHWNQERNGMFCRKCGQEIADDASFRPRCGASTGEIARPTAQGVSERQKTYELVSSVKDKLSGQRAHYKAIEADNLKLAKLRKSGKGIGRYIFSACWAVFCCYTANFADRAWVSVFYVVIAFVPLAICVLGALRRRKLIKDLEKDVASHFASIAEIYDSVKGNPLSFEHSIPYAIDSILAIVQKGRADTLKEALNTYEDDVRKSRMIDLQKATLNQATAARIAAEQARKYAKERTVVFYW